MRRAGQGQLSGATARHGPFPSCHGAFARGAFSAVCTRCCGPVLRIRASCRAAGPERGTTAGRAGASRPGVGRGARRDRAAICPGSGCVRSVASSAREAERRIQGRVLARCFTPGNSLHRRRDTISSAGPGLAMGGRIDASPLRASRSPRSLPAARPEAPPFTHSGRLLRASLVTFTEGCRVVGGFAQSLGAACTTRLIGVCTSASLDTDVEKLGCL